MIISLAPHRKSYQIVSKMSVFDELVLDSACYRIKRGRNGNFSMRVPKVKVQNDVM